MDVSCSLTTTTFLVGFITVSEFQFMSQDRLRSSRFSKGSTGLKTQGQDGIPSLSSTSSHGKLGFPDVALQPLRGWEKRRSQWARLQFGWKWVVLRTGLSVTHSVTTGALRGQHRHGLSFWLEMPTVEGHPCPRRTRNFWPQAQHSFHYRAAPLPGLWAKALKGIQVQPEKKWLLCCLLLCPKLCRHLDVRRSASSSP